MSTIKRVYFYIVSIITLGIFAAGGRTLLRLGFDIIKGQNLAEIRTPGFTTEQLSLGLALLIIGAALWFPFWRAVQRQVAGNPVEVGSAIRKLFLNIILLVTALVTLYTSVEFLAWLMSGVPRQQFPAGGLANLIVAGVIWYYHWRLEQGEGQPSPAARTLKRWYIYLLSSWGLVSLSLNLVQSINFVIFRLPVWGETIAYSGFGNSSLQENLSWIVLGGATWAFHWFYLARGDFGSTLRQVYVYLLAILGGALAGLVALITTLFNIFRFALGGVSTEGSTYFLFLGWAIPTILVATTVWLYHQKAVQEEAAQLHERQLSARRIYLYIMSFLGLATLISGLAVFLGILLNLWIHAVSSVTVVSAGWWHDQLSICLALLIVATPIWLYYWKTVFQMATEGGVAERGARSRRVYLYAILAIVIILLAADLVNIIYQLLNGLLQGAFGVDVLRKMSWSLQTLLLPVPVLLYHWRVLRQDQHLGTEKLPSAKTVTLLAGESAADLVSRLEQSLGSRIRLLHHLGQTPEEIPAMSDEEIDSLVSDIQAAPSDKVMLVAAGGRVMVLPYQDK
ncbi:DUF5671 domain-containing protein [Chloroflexota bacterium]